VEDFEDILTKEPVSVQHATCCLWMQQMMIGQLCHLDMVVSA